MNIVYQNLLENAVMAMVLAVLVAVITRVVRHPPLAHFLWLLVLLKLVTPPLRSFEIPIPRTVPAEETSAATQSSVSVIADVGTAGRAAAEQELPVNFDRAGPDREKSGELSEVPAVLPPPVGLDLPLLAKTLQTSNRPEALDGRAGSLAPEVPLPERGMESGIMPRDPITSTPWSWESSLQVAGWVWLAGSTLWFAVAALRVMRFERCRREAELAPASLQAETRRLAREMGLARCPAICVVQGRLPPLLWAMTGQATILLPALLLEQMPPSQQAMVVAHEMAHFARRDHWFRWLEVFVLGIYWWFPVAWWARRQLHHAAEQCCDAWVVWLFPSGARCYARSLLETIDFLSGARAILPVGASSLGQFHFHSLQRRFRMILSKSMNRRMPWSMRIAASLVGLAVLSFSARGVWGQASETKAPEAKADTQQKAESNAVAPKTAEGAAGSFSVGPPNNDSQAGNALPASTGVPQAAAQPNAFPPKDGQGGATPSLAVSAGGNQPVPPPNSFQGGLPIVPAPGGGDLVPAPPGGLPAAGQPAANPALGPVPVGPLLPPQQANIEQRLQRLEAVTNQILQELRSLRGQNTRAARSRRLPSPEVSASDLRNAAQLNAVDEQINALAAEMELLKARMAQLKDARERLAPQRPVEVPRSDAVPEYFQREFHNPVPERREDTPPGAAPPSTVLGR